MEVDLKDLFSDKAKIKYGCAKKAAEISAENPGRLYPDFDTFVYLVKGDNNILKWNALKIIGNLSKVDDKKLVDNLIDDLIALLSDKSMITAANTIGALTEIAVNKPGLRKKIIASLLEVEKAVYYNKGEKSPECTNVAIGHVLKSLKRLGKDIYSGEDVQEFLKRQIENRRPSVRELSRKMIIN